MTVKELIEALQKEDPNLPVVVTHKDGEDYVTDEFGYGIIYDDPGSGEWRAEQDEDFQRKVLHLG